MSASSPLPPKLYFRIGEVAGLVGVEPHVLRYWEREFRSIRPTKSAKGQRVYSRRDVENLMRVRELLYAEGFTIAGAKKKLQRGGSEPAPPPDPPASDASIDAQSYAGVALERSAVTTAAAAASVSASASASLASASLAAALAPPVAVAVPVSIPDARMRDTLTALRREVEAFLAELGG
jgi:DNA-binding transcriptional MerR regulator